MNRAARACLTANCVRPPITRGMCNACYERFRTRQTAYGRFESVYVDSGPAREHAVALRAAGAGTRLIAEMAGVNRKTITNLLNGRPERGTGPSKRIRRDHADAIVAIPLPTQAWRVVAGQTLVDAIGSSRRIHALIANGWSDSDVDASQARLERR
jgi:hypothetical protein